MGQVLDLNLRHILLPDGTLIGAVVVAKVGLPVFLRHGQYLVRIGQGSFVLDLLDTLRGDGLQ